MAAVSALLYYSQWKENRLAQITSSDVIFFAQIKDPFLKWRVANDRDPALKELYTFIGQIGSLPYSLEHDIVPFIYHEGAIALLPEEKISPVILVRTKNPSAIIQHCNGCFYYLINDTILAFSKENVGFEKYFGKVQRSVDTVITMAKSKRSYIKAFLNGKKLKGAIVPNFVYNPFSQLGEIVIFIDKREWWNFHVVVNEDALAGRARDSYPHISLGPFSAPGDFWAVARNVFIPDFSNIYGIQKIFINDRAKDYFRSEILPLISPQINFGYIFDEVTQQDKYYISGRFLSNTNEDSFIEKLKLLISLSHPKEQKKLLPDKTYVYEEIASPENIDFNLISKVKELYAIEGFNNLKWYYQGDGKNFAISNDYGLMDVPKSSEPEIEMNYKWYSCINPQSDFDSDSRVYLSSKYLKNLFPELLDWNFLPRDICVMEDRASQISGFIW